MKFPQGTFDENNNYFVRDLELLGEIGAKQKFTAAPIRCGRD